MTRNARGALRVMIYTVSINDIIETSYAETGYPVPMDMYIILLFLFGGLLDTYLVSK